MRGSAEDAAALGDKLATALEKKQGPLNPGGRNLRYDTSSKLIEYIALELDTSSGRSLDQAFVLLLSQLEQSPLQVEEFKLAESKQPQGSRATLYWTRSNVAGRPTRFGAAALTAVLTVGRETEGGEPISWQLSSLGLEPTILLASAADVDRLNSCTSTANPSTERIHATTFTGTSSCGTTEYSYSSNSADQVAWAAAPPNWEVFDGPSKGSTSTHRWLIAKNATLTIAQANYWPNIAVSDCYCGEGNAGYVLTVDTVSGEVVRYRAGLTCVGC